MICLVTGCVSLRRERHYKTVFLVLPPTFSFELPSLSHPGFVYEK
jgi:hypothetical protein